MGSEQVKAKLGTILHRAVLRPFPQHGGGSSVGSEQVKAMLGQCQVRFVLGAGIFIQYRGATSRRNWCCIVAEMWSPDGHILRFDEI